METQDTLQDRIQRIGRWLNAATRRPQSTPHLKGTKGIRVLIEREKRE
jgi:hypothetical protein